MAKSKKNGVVNHGIPYGSMVPPAGLSTAIKGQVSLESKLILNREEIKKQTAKFYHAFKAKFTNAGLADFARQFNKDVPFKRDDYKKDATYLAIDNMFRYMPEIKGKHVAKRGAGKQGEKAQRKAKQTQHIERAERLVMAICNQIGIPSALLEIAAKRCGYPTAEIEALMNVKTALIDIGMGTYQMVVRKTGEAATKQLAKSNVELQRAARSIPTKAELANQQKGNPVVESVQVATPAKPGKHNVTTSAPLTTKQYRGKGQYARVTTLKPADNLSTPAPTA